MAELSAFDYSVRYRPDRTNKNTDTLCRQPAGEHVLEQVLPGTAVPPATQEATVGVMHLDLQAAVAGLPCRTPADLHSLQGGDAVIGTFHRF